MKRKLTCNQMQKSDTNRQTLKAIDFVGIAQIIGEQFADTNK